MPHADHEHEQDRVANLVDDSVVAHPQPPEVLGAAQLDRPVAARLGCHGFDLIDPADWPTLRKHGLEHLLPTKVAVGGDEAAGDPGPA